MALQGAAEQLKKKLPQIRSAEFNAITGSLLIHYAGEALLAAELLASTITESGLPLELIDESLVETGVDLVGRYSSSAGQITSTLSMLDSGIKSATGNQFDLRVLLPIAAVGIGAGSILINGSAATPLWLTLMIFGFTSFVVLHHAPGHVPATAGEMRAPHNGRSHQ